MDERVNRVLGQVGRGTGRPTTLHSLDLTRDTLPQGAPSMWDRTKRFFSKRATTTRATSRGTRR